MPRATVIPELGYPDVEEAVSWLCEALGFRLRIGMGSHRAQLKVGDGAVVVMERRAGDGPCSVMVRVEDVDRHYERARSHGARIDQPPTDFPYGERQYGVTDFAGHRWTFSQSIGDVDPAEWGGRYNGGE